MKKKPEVTDEDIEKHMNFDQLIARHNQSSNRAIPRILKNAGLLASAALITSLAYYWVNEYSSSNKVIPEIKNNSKPTLAEEQPVSGNAKDSTQFELPTLKQIPNQTTKRKQALPVNKKQEDSADTKIEFKQEYVAAEPAQGYPHLYTYFDSELKYPVVAIKDSIQGVETVAFVINKDGRVEHIEVLNSLGSLFDLEAERLIKNMPKWKPATLNGRPVPSKISVPFSFKIIKIKK